MSRWDTMGTYLRGAWELAGVSRAPVRDGERLERARDRRLRRIVAHAYATVPYYRRLFDGAGVRPVDVRTAADLARLPITTKGDLRRTPVEDLVASGTDLARCLRPRSSGTSGEPFTVYWGAGGACVFYALTARALRMAGARVTDTMMVIGPGYYPEGLLVQRLGLGRVINVSPLQEPPALLAALAEVRPQVVHAYSSVLKSLVAHLRAVGVRPHRPRVLVASADYLDEGTRSACRELFGVAPIQMYGAAETGRIGAECRLTSGIHVFTDFVVLELLPVGGEEGAAVRRVVLTDLTNFTMPFLRYDQGDLAEAVMEKCGCGMAFPRLRLVRARASDVVRLPSGATVSALKLGAPLWAARGVDAFKIIQPSISTLIVRVVREDGCEASAIHEAVAALAALVPDLHVELDLVPRIERDPSGKVTGFQPLADPPA